jgi:DNA-directed RNA polymerase subunit RPC12/RpoP
MSWREKLTKFMYGRYGVDQLTKFMLASTFVLCILSIFAGEKFRSLISTLILLLIILAYFRMFSRNIYKRAAENEKYLKLTGTFRRKINTEKQIAGQRKYYRFYSCPGCGQRIRVPKGRGRIQIRCPKCNEKFIKKS